MPRIINNIQWPSYIAGPKRGGKALVFGQLPVSQQFSRARKSFFMENLVLNILSSNNFFRRKQHFPKKLQNCVKKFLDMIIFWVILRQKRILSFLSQISCQYFHVKQLFRKKQYFQRKLQKTVFWGRIRLFFRERGCLMLSTHLQTKSAIFYR